MQKTKKNAAQNSNGQDVEVLYQKMGNRWFAFSVVEGEVFMGSISQEEIDALEAAESKKTFEMNGNS
jgi:hypothetical protein